MDRTEFRKKLEQITRRATDDEQWREIELLRAEYPHSLRRLPLPAHGLRFNCFLFALNMDASRVHLYINSTTEPAIYAGACFVLFLVCHRVLIEKDLKSRSDGDLLIYYVADVAVHAGRALGERVVSKWGGGLLLEHDMLDVPANYESLVRCYEAVSPEVAEVEFVKYARCMGYEDDAA